MKILKSYRGDVFIAIPATKSISPETCFSLFSSVSVLMEHGFTPCLEIAAYDCHVDDQRNSLVREFLESSCETFVFIDSDLHFDPEDLVSIIKHDRDVVAGVYPKKCDERDFPVRFLEGEIWTDEDGLIEVESVPAGFLKIKRHVLETLYDKVKKFSQKTDGKRPKKIPLIFERTLIGNIRRGGDVEFCRKYRELGGRIFVDPSMQFDHIGEKDYSGSLSHYLRARYGLVDRHIVKIINKVKDGTATVKDFISLRESWDNKWAPGHEMISVIPDLTKQSDGKILEIGSGLTTLLLGASGRSVTSLEHDPYWVKRMSSIIGKCGFGNVNLVYRKIVNGWYDFYPEDDYDMILIDGPTRKSGNRFIVTERLKSVKQGCVFVIDDVDSGLDMTDEIASKFGVKFQYFGRMAIGVKK